MIQRKNKSILSILLVLILIATALLGCNSGGGTNLTVVADGTTPTPPTSPGPSVLSWEAPTKYSDNTPILAGDLKGYKVYYSAWSGTYYAASYYFVPSPNLSVTIDELTKALNLTSGTYYFVVSAVDSLDMESDLSNEVSKSIN
jgi:hypothetical protein